MDIKRLELAVTPSSCLVKYFFFNELECGNYFACRLVLQVERTRIEGRDSARRRIWFDTFYKKIKYSK